MRERTQEIYAELRGMNLPAEAWALIAELNNLNLVHPDHIAAEAKRAKDRERKRVSNSTDSTDTPIILDNNLQEGGVGETISTDTPLTVLKTVLDEERARAVIAHRKAKRAPLTLFAAQKLAKRLKTFDDPGAAADEMIERGWQTIKRDWLKDPPNGKVLRFEATAPKRTYREIVAERNKATDLGK